MLHVYGDNILECWRLTQYANREGHKPTARNPNNILQPEVNISGHTFKLMPSPDLVPVAIRDKFSSHRDSLRENPDAIITNGSDILATFEFCSALPAGNNAWQRHGRALSICLNGVSHFHIAKIGGYELDSDRNKKATRLPNPLVLISYLAMSNGSKPGSSYFVPIINEDTSDTLGLSLGDYDCRDSLTDIVRSLIAGEEKPKDSIRQILKANLELVEAISKPDKSDMSLSKEEWRCIANNITEKQSSPLEEIVNQRKIRWKKSAPSNKSKTGIRLQKYMESNFQAIGDSKIPICLAKKNQLDGFQAFLDDMYGKFEMFKTFNIDSLVAGNLLITCDSGFKPRGDDSRPARGLTPFAKSLVDESSNTKILVFLYGPCKEYQWNKIRLGNLSSLAESNGLWESIYKMADFLILDSENHEHPLAVEIEK